MKYLMLSGAVLLSTVSGAQAEWRSERTTTGPNGVISRAETTATRDGNMRVKETRVERSNGTGYDRQVIHVWDAETKFWTRSVTGETAGGQVWTNDGSGSCADRACSGQSRFNGPGGRSIETQTNTRWNRDGGTRNRSWSSNTGRSGEGQRTWRRLR